MTNDELAQLKARLLDHIDVEAGQCYRACKDVMLRRQAPDFQGCAPLVYVEGLTWDGKEWLPHAWLELAGSIWDPLADDRWPGATPEYKDAERFDSQRFRELVTTDGVLDREKYDGPLRPHECDDEGYVIGYTDRDSDCA